MRQAGQGLPAESVGLLTHPALPGHVRLRRGQTPRDRQPGCGQVLSRIERRQLVAPPLMNDQAPRIHWLENGAERSALWHSESGLAAPKKVVLADDTMSADTAYRLALEGTALLWRG